MTHINENFNDKAKEPGHYERGAHYINTDMPVSCINVLLRTNIILYVLAQPRILRPITAPFQSRKNKQTQERNIF